MRQRLFPRRGVLAFVTLCAALAATLALAWLHAGAVQAGPLAPTQDPFYSYTGSLSVPNGTVLRTRTITFDAMGLDVPVTSTQIVYRTTDELGQPTVAVTTVVTPVTGATGKIISYQWAYDGLASNCDPSYAIQGGTPTEGTNADEQLFEVPMLAAGDTVVTSDYEGEDNAFAAGRQEGQITLDGIKAAENLLALAPTTQVVLMGYSGGAIASDWAAELAPTYAPTLDLVGTALGGIAVDLNHNLTYVNGSQEWSGAIPAALIGIARAFHINLTPYESSYGAKLLAQAGGTCLESDLGAYPGLTYEKLLNPKYTNIDQIPAIVKPLNHLIMGSGGVPEEPFYMGVGDADGTGDDVMIDADDEALAQKYCGEGLPVQFTIYNKSDHGTAGEAFLPAAAEWAIQTLAGVPAHNGCASIPKGDSLAPLATVSAPRPARTAAIHLRFRRERVREVRLSLRAAHAAAAGLVVKLENASGRVLATRRVNAARNRLIRVNLIARSTLKPGRYRVFVRYRGRTMAKLSFRVRARH
jgi:hypothetical protein